MNMRIDPARHQNLASRVHQLGSIGLEIVPDSLDGLALNVQVSAFLTAYSEQRSTFDQEAVQFIFSISAIIGATRVEAQLPMKLFRHQK